MRIFLIAGLLAGFGSVAMADSISTYDINFFAAAYGPPYDGNVGVPPTTAAFTYDNTTESFSDFIVTWQGIPFDLTASANDPTMVGSIPCLGGLTGAAASFALLDGQCGVAPPILSPSYYGPSYHISGCSPHDQPCEDIDFRYVVPNSTPQDTIDFGAQDLNLEAMPYQDVGGFTISAIPEPSALIPLALFCAFAVVRRIRTV